MKVGILTFHSALNVGAVLQAYSLQKHLVECGYEVEFINYQPNPKRLSLRSFIGKGFKQTVHKLQDLYYTAYYSKKNRFNGVLNCGDQLYETVSELKSHPPECDVYIAGSDQIWNFGFSRKFDEAYFLAFGDETIKRVAFSASIGQNRVPEDIAKAFTKNLKRFDLISVREKNSVELISQLVGERLDVQHICDPTFLLNKDQFKLIEEAPTEPGEYIVSYVLPHYEMGEDLVEAFYFVEKELATRLINLRNPNTCHRFGRAVDRVVTPQKWLGYFKSAKLTICCSFHAVVFSLIYHKEFIVISPYENNRILSLLEEVGLSDRCVYNYDQDRIRSILKTEIDWSSVDDYFTEERERSVSFLQKAMALV